jgi:transposase
MMVMVLLDCKGVLLVDFMEKGTTINAASYCATLEWLREAIKQQCPGLLTTGVLLLHNNAWPHVMTATQQLLQHFRWTILEQPPYSPKSGTK